jgi:hypothetical protein
MTHRPRSMVVDESSATIRGSAVYLYPWDVVGDPGAVRRVAETGAREVVLAAVYHDVRAITPFHPAHRIVTKRAGPLYGPRSEGSFERAGGALREAGMSVTAWVVVTHNESLALGRPELRIRNAFGDSYPWALCCANPGTRDYAAGLAAEIGALDCVDRIELEACGWFGFEHLSPHDKTGDAGGWLYDVCWCPWCEAAFAAAGLDVSKTRGRVRDAIDASTALPEDLSAALANVRARLAGEFMRDTVAMAGKPVLLQVSPDPLACGANPGFAPEDLAVPDELVLNCASGDLSPITRLAGHQPAVTLRATGSGRDALVTQARATLAAGASGLRFYHAGLATAADLTAIRAAIAETTDQP